MTTTTENITTDVDLAYAVGTAADTWNDTDYWMDETSNTIGLIRGTTYGGQALGLHMDEDVISWGLWQYDADGVTLVDDGLSSLTDETIASLATRWQTADQADTDEPPVSDDVLDYVTDEAMGRLTDQ